MLNSSCQWVASHVRKTGNVAVHRLARYVLRCNIVQVWHFDCPPCIRRLYLRSKILLDFYKGRNLNSIKKKKTCLMERCKVQLNYL